MRGEKIVLENITRSAYQTAKHEADSARIRLLRVL